MLRSVYVVMILVILTACDSDIYESEQNIYENTIEDFNIQLKKIDKITIAENDSMFIGKFLFPKFHNNQIILGDRLKPEIFFVDISSGQIVNRIKFSIGKGPGEVMRIGSFEVTDDRIYISDGGNFRWSVFDLNGKYLKTANPFYDDGEFKGQFVGNADIMGYFNNKLYVSIIETKYNREYEFSKSKAIAILDTSLIIDNVFGQMDFIYSKIRMRNQMAALSIDKEGMIYYIQTPSFRVYKYNSKGKLQKAFGVKDQFNIIEKDYPSNVPRDISKKIAETFSHTWSVNSNSEFIITQYVNLNQKFFDSRNMLDREHYLKFYDKEGNYFPEDINIPGWMIALDEKNKLYILTNNEPGKRVIEIYKIQKLAKK